MCVCKRKQHMIHRLMHHRRWPAACVCVCVWRCVVVCGGGVVGCGGGVVVCGGGVVVCRGVWWGVEVV